MGIKELDEPFYRFERDPDRVVRLRRAPVIVGVGPTEIRSGLFTVRQLRGFFGGPGEPILQEAQGITIDGDGAYDIGGPVHHAISAIQDCVGGERKARLGGRTNSVAIVLHGPPGNGKTWAAAKAISVAQAAGAIVLMPAEGDRDMDGWHALKACTDVLRNEGVTAPIVWWIDDVPEAMWKHAELEEFLIANFDGRNSRDNVVLVCTTNYGHAMPARFWNRPSRCISIFFGPPTAEMLEQFFKSKGVNADEIPAYVKAVYGQSLDAAANLVFTVQATGMSVKALSRDQEMRRALAARRIDYRVASELIYGSHGDGTEPVTLPDGTVIDPVSMEPMAAATAEGQDAEARGQRFPNVTRAQLEDLAMSLILSGIAQPANSNGRGLPRDVEQALRNFLDNGGVVASVRVVRN